MTGDSRSDSDNNNDDKAGVNSDSNGQTSSGIDATADGDGIKIFGLKFAGVSPELALQGLLLFLFICLACTITCAYAYYLHQYREKMKALQKEEETYEKNEDPLYKYRGKNGTSLSA